MNFLVDSDVLIWHLKGNEKAKIFLKTLVNKKRGDMAVSAMQRAEVVFFMRKEEEERTLLLLSKFKTIAVDEGIVDLAGSLYRKWNPSHGIDINDAFLAATALKYGGQIFTLNVKHFPMPEIHVTRAWE